MKKLATRYLLTGLLTLILACATSVFGQGLTTSEISGLVTDQQGQPIVGAKVSVVHVPTGTKSAATTLSTGEYDVAGLRPGGPYTVTVEAPGIKQTNSDIYLDLGSVYRSNFNGTDIVKLAAVQVEGTRFGTTFDSNVMSFGTNFNAAELAEIATVRRDVQDIQNLDPRAALMQVSPTDTQFTISFAGQNPRENLFLIDGVSATDNFGLNSNGYAGFRNPLPPEWIESISADLSPYDILYSGFSGGILNTSLKSGTNELHGSVYEIYQGTHFRGGDPVFNPFYGNNAHEPIQAHTTGATFGGAIIKDKLFFFLGYDAFREIAAPPVQNYVPLPSDVQTIVAHALSLGFNPGSLIATNHLWQQNFVGKIDWNISDAHRFEFTFRHTAGEAPNFYNYTSSFETSLSSSWYNTYRTDQSYTVKLNSDWSHVVPNLRTEIEGTYKRYNGTAKLSGADFPAVTIDNTGVVTAVGTAPYAIFLGTYYAYQNNNIYTWEQEEHAYGEYTYGNHNFKFGVQFDRTGYTDTFIPNYLGSYTFATIQDFLNNTPTFAFQEVPANGYTLASDVSHYYLMNISPLVQDTWRPNSHLSIVAGLRMDYPYEPQKPIFSPLFYNTYGYTNSTTMSGNYVISPRIGFNYTLPTQKKTQLRGGIGLFLGANPVVWYENSFNNAGQLNSVSTGSTSSSATTAIIPGYTFTGAKPAPLPVAPSSAVPSFDYADPNFKWPSQWKLNLAVDRELGFLDSLLTFNIDLAKVNKDAITRNINIKQATSGPAFMPDGAIRYNGAVTPTNIGTAYYAPGYTSSNLYVGATSTSATTMQANPATAQVYELTNTDKGGSQVFTVNFHRPMRNGWAFSLAYSHTHATSVDPSPSSVASSNTLDNYGINPNDNIAYRSLYATPDKFVVTGSKRFKFFATEGTATTFNAQFTAQTGQPFSYVFKGDANGDGISSADLFYVPTGPNDPKVMWASATEEANFFQWLAQNPKLGQYAGGVAPRNAFYAQWQRLLNVRIEQQLPVWGKKVRLTTFWDCYNFANLLNKNWGQVSNFNNSFNVCTVAGTGYNPAGNNGLGQYIYVFNPGTLGVKTIYPDMSRWSMQVGARLEF